MPVLARASVEVVDPGTEERFDRAVHELASIVLGEGTLDTVLELVASLAQSTITGVRGASVSLRHDGGMLETRHASSEDVAALDHVQYEHGGPCVATIDERHPHNVGHDEIRTRWPEFAAAAERHGIQRVLSVPLQVRAGPIGALNLYGVRPEAFEQDDEERARLFAHRAAVVLANAAAYASSEARTRQLLEALETRDVIGQAKGIIMAREQCSAEEAFDILRQASQRTHRKLRDIALELVRSVHQRGRRR